MKPYRILILSLVLSFILSPHAAARSHTFLNLDIQAWVREDGRLDVEEHRTVRFDGRFTGMFQWIDKSAGITVANVRVREGGRQYERNPRLQPGPAGTFYVKEERDSTYIDWSFLAVDETKTFTLSYTIGGAVRVHDDAAELYFKYVGDQWEQPTEEATVTLHLPAGAAREDIRAWGHGPLHGEVAILNPQTVQWTVSPLPAKTMLEGRTTFPTFLVDQAGPSARTGRAALPQILAEEEKWARQANFLRLLARLDWVIAGLLLFAALGYSIYTWFQWGREYRPGFDGEYYRELPGSYSPAEMSVLYTQGRVSVRDLTATILDLARRGFLKVEETFQPRGLLGRRNRIDYILSPTDKAPEKLARHEQLLMKFLFVTVDLDNNGKVSLGDITAYAKRHKTSFAQFWHDWQKAVKKGADKYSFFDSVKPKRNRLLWLALASALLAIPLFVLKLIASGLAGLAAALVLLIGASQIHRRSRQGAEEFAQWKAFRRFLLHFSEMDRREIPSLVIWEHYLVYAVSLGVAKQVIRQLPIAYPGLEEDGCPFGRGWYYSTAGTMGLERSLSRLTTSMQGAIRRSVSTAGSKASSGSGSGGGFSGGGGGGAGGGGGGVR
ncbi:MAG: DUF2207 domain-containing protein [Limnochordia bacterium]